MLKKILISAGLSLLIFELITYITYKRENKILFKLNKSILQSTMMFFADRDIKESELAKFKDFVLSRVSEQKLDGWITNFMVKVVDIDTLGISYCLRRSSGIQEISYEIRKNMHPQEENDDEVASSSEDQTE